MNTSSGSRAVNLGLIHRPVEDLDAAAIVTPEGDVTTFGDVETVTAGLAAGLRGRGLIGGDRVGVLAENSPEYVLTVLGIQRAGLVAVPLNTRQPPETLAFIARDADLRLVFTDETHDGVLENVPGERLGGEAWDRLSATPPVPEIEVDGEDVALQMYTSGSTGLPKGVLLSHAAQHFTVEAYVSGVVPTGDADRVLVAAPLYHKNASVQVKVALRAGATVVLLPRFDARAYLRAAAAHRVTTLTGVPTMFALALAERDELAALDLSSVERIAVGSAPFTEAFARRLAAAFPDAKISNGYGTTEVVAVLGDHPRGLPRPRTSVGYVIGGVETRLVEPDGADATETADGSVEGELWVRSPGMMNGYHRLPGVTAARVVDGWYRTGDVMRRDPDGWHFFVGRVDDMFVCGGENIYPGDVEQLLERHPDVHQAAVVAVPDEVKGALPVAYVVPAKSRTVTEEELKSWTLKHGPAYAHPRAVWITAELPLAGTNKLDKPTLSARAARRFRHGSP